MNFALSLNITAVVIARGKDMSLNIAVTAKQRVLEFAENRYNSLFVDRGPIGGNMTTDELHLVVNKYQTYRIGKKGLEMAASALLAIDLENLTPYVEKVQRPPYLEVEANWDKTPCESGSGNNILGDNGCLTIPSENIQIPWVEATPETLAYYGATLLKEGDVVRFPDEEYPIFKMTVGPRYIEDFLMTDRGGGFYLEYHHDKPHFHMPIRGGGYYILARWNDEKTKLQITGFKIPDGQAVYTKKGVIHCDATLTGSLIVGYDQADDCSTVLLRTEDKNKVKIEFREPRPMSKLLLEVERCIQNF